MGFFKELLLFIPTVHSQGPAALQIYAVNHSEDTSKNCKTELQFFTVTWTSILAYIVQCRSVDSSLQLLHCTCSSNQMKKIQLKTVNLITVIPLYRGSPTSTVSTSTNSTSMNCYRYKIRTSGIAM
jgi:hypothetical protein